MASQSSPDIPKPCQFHLPDLTLKVDRTVESKVEAISPLVDELMGTIATHECVTGHEFEIETALREALANAITHGNRQDPAKHVRVCCACQAGGGILIIVKDQGKGFDVADVPSPINGQNLYRSHGRGIYLVNLLMDDVHFTHGGTEIHMRKGTLSP